jgi:S1-C subfamily serine protease
MRIKNKISWFTIVMLCGLFSFRAGAQTTPSAAPKPEKTSASTRSSRVILENGPSAPQVVTILHRLNGLKVFRLLLRSSDQVGAIAGLDEDFQITGRVHTNVIAGLALDGGLTIAAWLPEADAEIPPPAIPPFAPKGPVPPGMTPAAKEGAQPPPAPMPGFPSLPFGKNLLDVADLKIITRDGQRLAGRYIGLDGLTGLSVITLTTNGSSPNVDTKVRPVKVGQHIRLIGPEPVPHSELDSKAAVYVRIGETEATVVELSHSPSGSIGRVKIKSTKLSPSNMGGVAISDSGETLGIVDAVKGNEATLVPLAQVQSAAKRVITRQASVPRPWLGIQGEPIKALPLERILRGGWQLERALALTEKRRGILLTSVAPGSPAAFAQLKPGDVILSVNSGDVQNADDFSWLLDDAALGSSVHLTVARPGKLLSEALELKLGESPDPFFGLRMFEGYTPKGFGPGSLLSQGIETIAIKPRVAARFGATGGLLVVYVQPSTAAFKAGLRAGDVIESIDGKQPSSSATAMALLNDTNTSFTFGVVRNKQKLVMTLTTSSK